MSTPKDNVSALLQKLPDNASYEDIQYHVLEKVDRGLKRAETEGAVAHDDARTRLGQGT